MMYLISGQPGNGKTLRAMAMLLEFHEQNMQQAKEGKAEIRRFFTNVAGATTEENPDAFPWLEKLPEHNDWTKLPDGAFVLYDEAHSDGNTQGLERYGRLFPSTGKPGESDDPRIRSMSTHRHRGVDLVFVTQWPSKIHHQVRTLIGAHVHMNRAFGMERAGVLTWGRVQPDPYDERVRDKAEEEIWSYPKDLYKRYRSATLHTASHKFKVPARVWKGLSMVIAFIVAVWLVWIFIVKPGVDKRSKAAEPTVAATAAGGPAPFGAAPPAAQPLTPDEYAQQLRPRIPAQPWSAPVFDGRSVVSKPELYCMSSGTTAQDTTCTCVTEQGTKHHIRLDLCVLIAREGPQYNPYREPAQEGSQGGEGGSLAVVTHPGTGPAPGASVGTVIRVAERPVSTFPESVQNRYSGN